MDGISMASLWSSQQAAADHETDQESFMISNGSDCFHSYGSKMGPADQDNIFYPIHQVLQKAQVSQLLQTSGLDHQEAPALPLGNSEAAPADYCHHHQFGMADIQSQQVVNNNNNSTACSSLDDQSLDCLLSATNSNTADTSVEDDDGISVLFSDCKNLWNYNFGSNNSNDNTAVSTGDSHENNTNAAIYNRVNEQEQQLDHQATVSHRGWRKRKNIDHQSEGGFKLISSGNNIEPRMKKRSRLEKPRPSSSNISFQQANDTNNNSSVLSSYVIEEPDPEAIAQMKEMIYRAAAFRPVNLGLEVVEKPKRKNVRISTDPQTVAARQRREKISERIRVLQRLVPGGIKMDTASMLDEAASYLKFLRSQVKALENLSHTKPDQNLAFSSLPFSFPMQTHFSLQNHCHNHQSS